MTDLSVTIIQSDLYWENIDANLSMFEEKIWQIEGKQHLILLPEMFTTGFTMNPSPFAEIPNGKTHRWMAQMAAQTGAVVIGSYIVNDRGHFYNRLLAMKPDGSHQQYDKRHLFSLMGEEKEYSPGKSRTLIAVNGWKILPLICYDLRFPVWSRSRKSPESAYEYDVVLYVANWPKQRIKSWDALLKARAIENNCFSIGTNRTGVDGFDAVYTGHSGAYTYLGETLSYSEEEEILSFTLSANALNKFRSRFPFQKDSDDFTIDPD
ncbi:nitrilase family protein [Marinoscillum sp. MHG1-6]|uniref:nitrilase family protein n=1 Tax=Marinoscillum sp. MHG1-6 TaxID=2959627 RepID=UPI0021580CAD|nr:nitrilase family protein [Marinoscillum sp. MHG1-6]